MKAPRYTVKVVSLRVRETAATLEGRIYSWIDAKEVLLPYFESVRDDRERLVALALTNQNIVIGLAEVSAGGASEALVDPKVLFRTLLVMGATRFIVAHNHPSGDPKPSPADISLTRRLQEAGRLLELECLDHLIVGDGTGQVVSFSETGRLAGWKGEEGTR